MKYFSMFSGVGGFELGIGELGECVGFSEIDKDAIEIYEHLQSFPIGWTDGKPSTVRKRLMGNAAQPNIIRELIHAPKSNVGDK